VGTGWRPHQGIGLSAIALWYCRAEDHKWVLGADAPSKNEDSRPHQDPSEPVASAPRGTLILANGGPMVT
jgi:hypothetical protein